jgi:hypothetical protein
LARLAGASTKEAPLLRRNAHPARIRRRIGRFPLERRVRGRDIRPADKRWDERLVRDGEDDDGRAEQERDEVQELDRRSPAQAAIGTTRTIAAAARSSPTRIGRRRIRSIQTPAGKPNTR